METSEKSRELVERLRSQFSLAIIPSGNFNVVKPMGSGVVLRSGNEMRVFIGLENFDRFVDEEVTGCDSWDAVVLAEGG